MGTGSMHQRRYAHATVLVSRTTVSKAHAELVCTHTSFLDNRSRVASRGQMRAVSRWFGFASNRFSFLPLMDFAAHVGGLLMGTGIDTSTRISRGFQHRYSQCSAPWMSGTSMVMFGSRPVVGEWMVVQIPGCSGGAPRPDITQ